MASTPFLVISDEQKQAIREGVKLSEKGIKEDVEAILEWFKEQQHLPRIDLDPRVIECILLSRKGSLDQTKQKIDMMYAIKNYIPEMAAVRDVKDPIILNSLKGCTFTVLPKLNHDFTRICLIQYKDVNFFEIVDLVNFCWTVMEYRLLNDYFAGDRYIFDMKDFTLGHFTKYTPALLKNMEIFIRKAYGVRIFGVHIINAPLLINKFLAFAKMALSEKIQKRINIHSSYEDLYSIIDKDILPCDLNGSERAAEEILGDWLEELGKDDTRKYLMEQLTLKSDESLRLDPKSIDDEIFGVSGSLKKIDIF